MVKVCIYCNRKYPDGNITFHKLPSNKERRKKWLSAMKLPCEDIDKNSYLCSEHFEKKTYSCLVVNNVVHRFLFIEAVPSIFDNTSTKIDVDTDSSKDVETPQEYQSTSPIQVYQQNQTEEEDYYYYKIMNGVIHRFLKTNENSSDLAPITTLTTDENPPVKIENDINPVPKPVEFEIKEEQNFVHVEDSAKVKVLPVFPPPVEIWNGEIISKESLCDFKTGQSLVQEAKPIYEDMLMDTNDVNLEIINNYSHLNGLSEVDVNFYEPESLRNGLNELELSSYESETFKNGLNEVQVSSYEHETFKNGLNEVQVSSYEPENLRNELHDVEEGSYEPETFKNELNEVEVSCYEPEIFKNGLNEVEVSSYEPESLKNGLNEVEVSSYEPEDFKNVLNEVEVSSYPPENFRNALNEVEVSSYEPENLEVNHQVETSISKDREMDAKVPKVLKEEIFEEGTSYEPVPKKRRACKRTYSGSNPVENTGDDSMKALLYKCLENKDKSDLDVKLKRYTKCKLTELLTTALNYIESLENKLTITTEENTQYEMKILELQNLLHSIGETNPSKNSL